VPLGFRVVAHMLTATATCHDNDQAREPPNQDRDRDPSQFEPNIRRMSFGNKYLTTASCGAEDERQQPCRRAVHLVARTDEQPGDAAEIDANPRNRKPVSVARRSPRKDDRHQASARRLRSQSLRQLLSPSDLSPWCWWVLPLLHYEPQSCRLVRFQCSRCINRLKLSTLNFSCSKFGLASPHAQRIDPVLNTFAPAWDVK
jgi:hypothetical protein